MLKVLPVQSKETQKELCETCRIAYRPDALAYAASVNEEFVGICQFKLTSEGGVLYDIVSVPDRAESPACSTFEALFVMGRGTLNFIDLCGVHQASFVGDAPDEPLLCAIGFQKDEQGKFSINLEGFFTDHCHNHA